jgi:hypothetical protein
VFSKIIEGAFQLVLAVFIVVVVNTILVWTWRGIKLGARKLMNLRRPAVAVVES